MNEVARLQDYQPPATASAPAMTPMQAMYDAVNRGASVEVVERLAALAERWEANQARRAFDAAMAAARAAMPVIVRNREVSFGSGAGSTNYKHEDLAGIATAIGPVLAVNGLSYRFRTDGDNATVAVTCIISHRDGHSEETTLSAAHDKSGGKNAIQAIGSATTYLQRYTLKAALGLAASNDDDGRATSAPPPSDEFISPEQVAELRQALEFRGVAEARALKAFKVESLDRVRSIDFKQALAIINRAGAR